MPYSVNRLVGSIPWVRPIPSGPSWELLKQLALLRRWARPRPLVPSWEQLKPWVLLRRWALLRLLEFALDRQSQAMRRGQPLWVVQRGQAQEQPLWVVQWVVQLQEQPLWVVRRVQPQEQPLVARSERAQEQRLAAMRPETPQSCYNRTAA